MISYNFFSLSLMAGTLLPVAGFVIILLLSFLEREVNILEIENKRVCLEHDLQQSQFMQLNQQIQPHFLFNTLNAITSLGRLGRLEDSVKAVENLSLFLRYNYMEKEPLVTFEKELQHTENYLRIQKTRFGEKLQTVIEIDSKARDTLLPPYTLQTLVENAFKHGLDKKTGQKILKISLHRQGNWASLVVIDNGPELRIEDSFPSKGIGLENLRKRLEITFDMRTELKIQRNDEMTEARIDWPYTPEVKL
ncbi:sensor histidine kinase [Desulfosporosinus fructosivorans]|uniref:Sensor histidine kinase n=1 Tax=Desulfosporosinus fructosivorans TaxID=2018669 RepID=A0A4Z0QZS8_9FIRM|nr:histidine kinase [Desulfosporosinus fructosivorans]TGE35769.1 sensor histidine kinase [Desulfosporosinus fructosivorans]